jgi:threonine/homoserine/homoserine lactone efflux protein
MAIDVLPPSSMLATFLAASIVLAVTPGPGVVYIYIVLRSVADGRRHGLASVVGVAFGNLGNALAASAGLAGVFAVSAAAFTIVKYAGACYLIYLGVRML